MPPQRCDGKIYDQLTFISYDAFAISHALAANVYQQRVVIINCCCHQRQPHFRALPLWLMLTRRVRGHLKGKAK